jgi:mannosyltransferase
VQFNKIRILIFATIVIAFLLRIAALTTHSLWWDELQSVRTADPSNSFSEINQICKQSYDPAPGLFYYLLNVWFRVFGFTDFSARLFTALFGIASIPVMYLLGRKIQDKQTGIIAALLTAVNYFHIFYSLEVRFYSLLFFFSAVSYLFFLRSLDRKSLFNLLLYAASTLSLMLLHYFGILILVAQVFTWIYLYRLDIIRNFNKHKRIILTLLLMAILYLPFISGLFHTLRTETSALSGTPGNYFFIHYFKAFFGYSGIIVIPAATAFLLFIMVSFLFPETKINTANFLILYIWILIPPILAYSRTIFGNPTMGERYFIIILPGILSALALGIHFIKTALLRYGFIFLFFSASVISLTGEHTFYTSLAKDDFRGIVKYIKMKESIRNFHVLSDKNWHFKYYFDQYKLDPQYIDLKNYTDSRFYLTKEPYAEEKLISDTSLTRFWLISAHFANLEKMRHLARSLAISEHFFAIDSFESKDAFAIQMARKDPDEVFIRYTIPFAPEQLIELDFEKLLPLWDGEVVFTADSLPKGEYKMSISSRGTKAAGKYPHLSVFVNNLKVGEYTATSRFEQTDFRFEINSEKIIIKLRMENDLYIAAKNEDRNLFVRSIILSKTGKNFY